MAIRKGLGGPKTPLGKSVVSKNATKSGVYSSTLLLPDESRADFEALKERFRSDLQPKDLIEDTLVDDLVQLAWKKLRLDRFEQMTTFAKLHAPIRDDELARCPKLSMVGLEVVRSLFAMSDGERAEYWEAYQILKTLISQSSITQQDFPPTNHFLKKALESHQERIELQEITGNQEVNDILQEIKIRQKPKIPLESGESMRLRRFVASTIESMRSQVDCLRQYDELLLEWQAIQDERYWALMTSSTVSRAHDDLRRAFYKVLQELRKHRQWKMLSTAITFPPNEPEVPK